MRGRLVYFATWYLVRMRMRYVLPQNEYSWAYTKLLYYNTAEWLYQAGTVSSRFIVDRYVSCSYRKGRSMPPAEHALFRDRTRNAFVFLFVFVCFLLFFFHVTKTLCVVRTLSRDMNNQLFRYTGTGRGVVLLLSYASSMLFLFSCPGPFIVAGACPVTTELITRVICENNHKCAYPRLRQGNFPRPGSIFPGYYYSLVV